MRNFVLAVLLTLYSAQSSAAARLEDMWFYLISEEVGSTCHIELVKVENVVTLNNGLRREQWLLKTCKGNVEYRVEFYPPASFPNRKSPYQVTRIKFTEVVS